MEKTCKTTIQEIKKNLKGSGYVTLSVEQEIWDQGTKLSKPHNIEVDPKYIEVEVTNLYSLGYTVTYISQAK